MKKETVPQYKLDMIRCKAEGIYANDEIRQAYIKFWLKVHKVGVSVPHSDELVRTAAMLLAHETGEPVQIELTQQEIGFLGNSCSWLVNLIVLALVKERM